MARKFHFPALGGLLGMLGTIAGVVVKVPELTTTTTGKVATGLLALLSVVQSMTKPIQQPPSHP